MNKLKKNKHKTRTDSTTHIGLFDKLTKYSTVGFLRRINGTKGNSSSQEISASYDMTGRESEDHKLEIGVPILISKTTIDADAIHPVCDELTQCNFDRSDVSFDSQTSIKNRLSFDETKIPDYSTEENTDGVVDVDGVHLRDTKCIRSKSTSNLHRAELNLYLMRTSSIENGKILSVSVNNVDKLSVASAKNYKKSTVSELDSNVGYRQSHDSVAVNSSLFDGDQDDGFDLESAPFESLVARNIFHSIKELNDITRQINESEEFKSTNDIDLEYCAHRDNLPPSERRITMLRNGNHPKLFGTKKKDKFTNAWTDFKSWVDEERGKIKDVVNKHAAAQRVGANKSMNETTLPTMDASLGNILRDAEFFNPIQSSGENYSVKSNCGDTDTVEHANLHVNAMSQHGGSQCKISGCTGNHENHMNTSLSNAPIQATGNNYQDQLAEVKFKFTLRLHCAICILFDIDQTIH